MNSVFFNDSKFVESIEYKNFMDNNPGKGRLKIRAYAASEALPVGDLHVVVSTEIGGLNVIFFDGKTDRSGMIDTIVLPAPKLEINNLEVPKATVYQITVNSKNKFMVDMYDDICVLQNINYVPEEYYGN